jgi:hypothetical protein
MKKIIPFYLLQNLILAYFVFWENFQYRINVIIFVYIYINLKFLIKKKYSGLKEGGVCGL